MRINCLKLIRYGHFTDENLDFLKSNGDTDFQLVYGPNEAGKSSARLALEDFLFGIPNRSTFGYQHGSSNMQIGAQIQSKNETFEAIRRKGRANTLRDPETNEVIADADNALLALLHHTNRDTFKRMFSLDHERLREGGQSMLDAEDDVGRALFAATAGLHDLQSTLEIWEAEASELWAPRKSMNRVYYQAKDRFDEATQRVSECSVLARDWENLQQALEEIENQLESVREKIQTLEPRQHKLSRIRRLKAKVSHYFEIDQQISELGAVLEFPADAMETLNVLVSQRQIFATRIDESDQRISQLKTERNSLIIDEKVLDDDAEIGELDERRAQISKSKRDLPKREQELQTEFAKFQLLSDQLGWSSLSPQDVAKRIPSRKYSRLLRDRIGQKEMLEEREQNCRDTLRNTTRNRERLEEQLNDIGPVVNLDSLIATVETSQKDLDTLASLPQLQRQLEIQTLENQKTRRTLDPTVSEDTDIELLSVPSREVILNMLDEVRTIEKEQAAQRGKVKDAERDVRTIDEQIASFLKDEELVTEEDLAELRRDRDEIWRSLKSDFLGDSLNDHEATDQPKDLADRAIKFEDKVGETDALADRRFDNAEAEARHKDLLRTSQQTKRALRDIREKADEIDDEDRRFQERWELLWEDVPIEVSDPATMFTWWETRESLVSSMRTETKLRAEVKQLTELEKQALERLHKVLGNLPTDFGPEELDSVAESLAFSRECIGKFQEANSSRKNLLANLKAARADVKERQEDLEAIQQDSKEWSSEWSDALARISLTGSESTQAVSEKLDILDEIREVQARMEDLQQNRIEPIQAEIREFEDRVRAKVHDEYPELVGGEAMDTIRQLKERLDSSQQTKTREKELSKQLSDQEAQKKKIIEEQRDTSTSIDQMRALVGAADIEALRSCIRKSDKLRISREEQSKLEEELQSDGDGLSIAELQKESESVLDLDAARAEESRLETQLEECREEEKELLPKRKEVQIQLNEISGSDEAARAEFDKQCALAEMKDAIERYIPIRASALVLERSIERFRKERQGPLLKRASEIFNTLTLGSFSQIEVQMDGKKPALIAFRENKEEVGLSGLSEGSLDQLYLAMRVAAIEEHLRGTKASIPFVADDLFTNFDDERATAGIRVLLELSSKCQILFFTHHRHLMNLALNAAQDQICVTELIPATQE